MRRIKRAIESCASRRGIGGKIKHGGIDGMTRGRHVRGAARRRRAGKQRRTKAEMVKGRKAKNW